MLLFMPTYHGYKILVGASPDSFPTSLLMSLLTTHMLALPYQITIILIFRIFPTTLGNVAWSFSKPLGHIKFCMSSSEGKNCLKYFNLVSRH